MSVRTPDRLFSEALDHHRAGRLGEAERLYRQAGDIDPNHAEIWSNLGLLLLHRGVPEEAAALCRKAVALRPDFANAHINLTAALQASEQLEEATDAYRQLIPLVPNRADLWNSFGLLLNTQSRAAQAALAFREAIVLQPDFAAAHFNLAFTLSSMGLAEPATAAYRGVLALEPDNAAACANLGLLLAGAGQFAEAVACCARAAELVPDQPEILCNLGVVLHRQGNVEAAAAAYRRALELKPDYKAALGNLAAALQETFAFDQAAAVLEQALALDPGFDTAVIELIKVRRHICDWSSYEADHRRLLDFLAQKKDVIFNLLLMTFPSTPAEQAACARQALRHHNESTDRVVPAAARGPAGKLRIGYLSTDYRDHPVGRLLPELFARHDRETVELFGYALGPEDHGTVRRRIQGACDVFADLHPLSNRDAAELIAADAPDVLVDLTGATVGSRQEILALRPAPVQVSFLGWPGTTGADFIDFLVVDPFLVPAERRGSYAEKLVVMPHCHQPSDGAREAAAVALTRGEVGLPADAVVFCSFNNPIKMTPTLFDRWMTILHRVENSVLWLYSKSPATIGNLRRRAEARGIGPDRLVFAGAAAFDTYLARLRLADLFLDSFPYNAGSTCNDALWVGLPVLTCAGDTYVSRMAGSLLGAAGLPELITTSLDDYEELTVRLAGDPALLADVTARTRAARHGPLFDMASFTAALERAYAAMRTAHRQGGAFRDIDLRGAR